MNVAFWKPWFDLVMEPVGQEKGLEKADAEGGVSSQIHVGSACV
jgi:hypothetical protein